jgi:hypothetical protein
MSPRFDFVEFFSLAQWLYDTKPEPPSQCILRTIVNRAYYSALISVRDYTGANSEGLSGHSNVIQALRANGKGREANKLNSLKLKRVDADYKSATFFTARDIQICLQDSRLVLYAASCAPTSAKPYSQDFLDRSKFCVPQV